ncbi:MAG: hypothetical protein U0Q11_22590 [Vicinamibacterales bacterium]
MSACRWVSAGVASAERAIALTTQHVKSRMAHGKPLIDLQHVRFTLPTPN